MAVPLYDHAAKWIKYAFHLLLFGRFWPQALKDSIYRLCERPLTVACCYGLLAAAIGFLAWAAARHRPKARPALLLLIWTVAATALVLPMPLETLFDLSGNRYLYVGVAFCSMLLAIVLSTLRRMPLLLVATIWVVACSYLTLRSNRHWQTSTRISDRLLQTAPQAGGRTMILLSLPYCYKGIPMINAYPYGNFRRMHNVLYGPPLTTPAYDAAAFNMAGLNDGSEAAFVNDSTVRVTLLQWGTWWWYKDFGGYSYDTPDYRVDMRDQGHWFDLILRRPRDQYLLLYQQGDTWKELR